jgi:molecular chaperone DnaJ
MQTSGDGGVFALTEPCRECRGRGLVVDDPCPTCHGSGRGASTRTMQVRIPAGVKDGQRIRLRGKGAPGERGGPAGDLFVVVNVAPHPVFGRSGDNLTITAPITFDEAALGAEIKVPTLGSGPVTLRIPAGTPNGRTFRVRGRGATRKDGTRGDLLVTVDVVVPHSLSEEARAAVETLREHAGGGDPRAELFTRASS